MIPGVWKFMLTYIAEITTMQIIKEIKSNK